MSIRKIKKILNNFKSSVAEEDNRLMKFDEAQLLAESTGVIRDLLHSIKNPKPVSEVHELFAEVLEPVSQYEIDIDLSVHVEEASPLESPVSELYLEDFNSEDYAELILSSRQDESEESYISMNERIDKLASEIEYILPVDTFQFGEASDFDLDAEIFAAKVLMEQNQNVISATEEFEHQSLVEKFYADVAFSEAIIRRDRPVRKRKILTNIISVPHVEETSSLREDYESNSHGEKVHLSLK